jgi:hypothetical protein
VKFGHPKWLAVILKKLKVWVESEMEMKINFGHPKMKVWVGSEMARNANEN